MMRVTKMEPCTICKAAHPLLVSNAPVQLGPQPDLGEICYLSALLSKKEVWKELAKCPK